LTVNSAFGATCYFDSNGLDATNGTAIANLGIMYSK
jgi:hypothetical protein